MPREHRATAIPSGPSQVRHSKRHFASQPSACAAPARLRLGRRSSPATGARRARAIPPAATDQDRAADQPQRARHARNSVPAGPTLDPAPTSTIARSATRATSSGPSPIRAAPQRAGQAGNSIRAGPRHDQPRLGPGGARHQSRAADQPQRARPPKDADQPSPTGPRRRHLTTDGARPTARGRRGRAFIIVAARRAPRAAPFSNPRPHVCRAGYPRHPTEAGARLRFRPAGDDRPIANPILPGAPRCSARTELGLPAALPGPPSPARRSPVAWYRGACAAQVPAVRCSTAARSTSRRPRSGLGPSSCRVSLSLGGHPETGIRAADEATGRGL
jgi:hypothetical protein